MEIMTQSPVLIIGAGINGAAIARELVLQGVPVIVVDRADIASGATAYSSRLIHGGLRYLEYGEFNLVSESLAERTYLAGDGTRFCKSNAICDSSANSLWRPTQRGRSIFEFTELVIGQTSKEWPRALDNSDGASILRYLRT